MKVKPKAYQIITIIVGLLLVSAIFIIANLASAQGNSPRIPVIGESPIQLPGEVTIPSEPESPPIDSVSALDQFVYLPLVVRPFTCDLNPQEQEIATFAINHPDQGRPFMNCDPTLAEVARARALDMGTRNYFSHTNPDGYGPNYLVRQAGYILPTWYGTANDANNIESIAAGYTTAAAAWTGWLNSAGHRAHVLAEDPFWAAQTSYGIGYAYIAGSTYKHYWVFISAPPEG